MNKKTRAWEQIHFIHSTVCQTISVPAMFLLGHTSVLIFWHNGFTFHCSSQHVKCYNQQCGHLACCSFSISLLHIRIFKNSWRSSQKHMLPLFPTHSSFQNVVGKSSETFWPRQRKRVEGIPMVFQWFMGFCIYHSPERCMQSMQYVSWWDIEKRDHYGLSMAPVLCESQLTRL